MPKKEKTPWKSQMTFVSICNKRMFLSFLFKRCMIQVVLSLYFPVLLMSRSLFEMLHTLVYFAWPARGLNAGQAACVRGLRQRLEARAFQSIQKPHKTSQNRLQSYFYIIFFAVIVLHVLAQKDVERPLFFDGFFCFAGGCPPDHYWAVFSKLESLNESETSRKSERFNRVFNQSNNYLVLLRVTC